MATDLKDAYRYWRSHGRVATDALTRAREDMAKGTPRYGTWCAIEYNPKCEDGGRWIENVTASGLRLVGYADEISREQGSRSVDHAGWYLDAPGMEDSRNVNRGIVYRLPSRGREDGEWFAYGYADPNNDDCAYLVFDPKCHDKLEAARHADHIAERHAETEREYQEAWQKGREYYERLPEDIGQVRRKFLTLASATRRNRDGETASWLSELAEEWCALRKERETLFAEWSHMPGFAE